MAQVHCKGIYNKLLHFQKVANLIIIALIFHFNLNLHTVLSTQNLLIREDLHLKSYPNHVH